MSDYGQTGTIEMCKPSMRKKVMMKNELGRCTETEVVNGQTVIKDARVGDAEIVRLMAYVNKAPFQPTLNGFLTYCDQMDEKDFGSAERLYQDIILTVEEIDKEAGPLGDSQPAETPSSV